VQWFGERSYEIYLSHMFLVLALYAVFSQRRGKPLVGVPVLFASVILTAALLGELLARFYSEPMNRLLRNRLGGGERRLGSVVDGGARTGKPLTQNFGEIE
jgi:peptidoglycan/LPS O-acetylase OafA/YrhL